MVINLKFAEDRRDFAAGHVLLYGNDATFGVNCDDRIF